ncbi:hypothetical protein [Aureibacter tunicatorum]|uniref:Uncharacterized protein n=1 Tax=Aureibacter tunicatorum TaxID=866807 RepID=A0AAE3XJY9_9BACT|nr:hypothetical protein [Aureibacter tunicatorum]MDR6237890.1 hypothetical protein [Aureibacter tunicatorum]BDD02924.1 hypothetical protein AUTU_04070 [Aureibacter tunicatorum]
MKKPQVSIAIVFLSLIFLPLSIKAQKKQKEILLIRSAHDYSDCLNEDYDEAINEIVKFQPDIFFSETVSPDNLYGAVIDRGFAKQEIAYLLSVNNLNTRFVDKEIKKWEAQLLKAPNNLYYRAQLMRALYIKRDMNYEYQKYIFDETEKTLSESEIQQYYKKINTEVASVDSLKKYCDYRQKSEYHLIAFPAAKKLKLNGFGHMDNQDDRLLFHKYWDQSIDKYMSNEEEVINIFTVLNEEETKYRQQGNYLKVLNTNSFDTVDYFNYYLPLKYSKNQEAAKMYEYFWDQRNLKMAENVDYEMQEGNHQRGAIIVGASHGRLMKRYLEAKGYKIINIFNNELEGEVKELLETKLFTKVKL